MTTKAKGITLPILSPYIRYSANYIEVTDTASDYTSNASYSYKASSCLPTNLTAKTGTAPTAFSLTTQNADASYSAVGANFNVILGVGSNANASGNLVVKDTAGNGGAWNTSHINLGIYHLWVDAANRLRIKTSAPANDTDGNVVNQDFSTSAVYDPPNLAAGAQVITTVATIGVTLGDFVLASFSLDLQGIILSAYVSAANTISIIFQNQTAGAINLASGTLRLKVIKQ